MLNLLACVYSQILNIYFSQLDALAVVNLVTQFARNVASSGIRIYIKVEFLT